MTKHLLIVILLILFSGSYLYSQHRIDSRYAHFQNKPTKAPYSTDHNIMFKSSDSISGSWTYIAPMPDTLWGVTSYYLADSNKIFLCGGADDFGNAYTKCYFYNITTNTYTQKASLPIGRFSGKLVRIKDSLYLVGSANTSFQPDGALYRYDIKSNTWLTKTATQSPVLQEMAVCVWRDSLIITIGGSTNGFNGSTNSVRYYDPYYDMWKIFPNANNLYPDNITTADAECIGNDIMVVGGFSTTYSSNVYRGYIYSGVLDSLSWVLDSTDTPFGVGVYRVGGSQWGSYMLFGPALYDTICIPEIWAFNVVDSTWNPILPDPIDTVANIPSISVKLSSDSVYLYLFGGTMIGTLASTAHAERFASLNPIIGIEGQNAQLPKSFKLNQNYPNPFNPSTTISYELLVSGNVQLVVYDILGREIKTLVDSYQRAGVYKIQFDASTLASGIYFYRLSVNGFIDAKKMIVIK